MCSAAGARALDWQGRDISLRVEVALHPEPWHTSAPTLPSRPFLVRYSVTDSAGRRALSVARILYVECPAGEHLCGQEGGPGGLHCSMAGVCGIATLPQPVDALLGPASPSSDTEELSVELIGEAHVVVEAGTPFQACSADTPPGLLCDRGGAVYSDTNGRIPAIPVLVRPSTS